MITIEYPAKSQWKALAERPHIETGKLRATVSAILDDVRHNGDTALRKYGEAFDHVALKSFEVSPQEKEEALHIVSEELMRAIMLAHDNIMTFHKAQTFHTSRITTQPGVTCWQKTVPIQKVGLYIPGGTAPLFSTVLMLATPAMIAGCKRIVLCTPPGKDGKINPAVIAAARIAGVNEIYKVGGVQAIGAMAYGTETIPNVYKIFGPGNQYVMEAKQQVSLDGVAIDMPAGPSEVCVIADESANCTFVAADLLSQAEHGIDSQVLLLTPSKAVLDNVKNEVTRQLSSLPRKEITQKALDNSKLILVNDIDEAVDFSNLYAPEHLLIQAKDSEEIAEKIINAGSVFIGKYACESAGDYASGTNHTLPTKGYATAYSGVNLDSFQRKITFQQLTAEGVKNIGNAVEVMAAAEFLHAHKMAMSLRLQSIKETPSN